MDQSNDLERLSPKQRLLLETLLKERAGGSVPAPSVPENQPAPAPVSTPATTTARAAAGLGAAASAVGGALGATPVYQLGKLLSQIARDAVSRPDPHAPGRETPLLSMRETGSRPPFFCAHALLGSAFHYFALANKLSADQPFYALQAPGLDGQETALNRIEDFAAFFLPYIREVQPTGPYRLGGFSFGGLVALEMARQLADQGEQVSHLVIFGTDTPISISSPKLYRVLDFAEQFRQDAFKNLVMPFFSYDKRIALSGGGGHQKSADGADPTIAGLSPTLVRVVASHCVAAARYHPRPVPGKITLLETLEQQILNPLDAARGWDRLAAGGVDTHVITGNHLSMLDEPHLSDLAQKLDMILAEP